MQLSHIYYLYEIGGKKNQEDYIWPVAGMASLDSRIFVVCDGVGGSENGEIASRIISESMGAALKNIPVENITDQLIHEQLTSAKQALADYARTHRLNPDMATTFCLLALGEKKSFIAWCGDSRVYHLRNGEVLYKTSDHSLVNTLLKKGEISEEEALSHPQKNVILKAIKADDSPVEVENQWVRDVHPGDYFLLATDGLFENITEKEIESLLDQNDHGHFDVVGGFQQYCFNKTRDNYSMYLVKIGSGNVPVARKQNRIYLLWLLILIVVAWLMGSWYFSRHRHPAESAPAAGNVRDTIETEIVPTVPKDSLPYVEIVNSPGSDSGNTRADEKKPAKAHSQKKH